MSKKLKQFSELYSRNISLKDIANILEISYSTAKRYKKYLSKNNNVDISLFKIKRKKVLSTIQIEEIIDFYISNAAYFNMKHFYEHFVIEQMGYDISYSTLKRYFNEYRINTKKTRRKTKRRRIKEIEIIKENPSADITKIPRFLDKNNIHPRKPKTKYFGEIIEADASPHEWCLGLNITLHIFVDKSTSKILGGCFTKYESLEGYYIAFKQVLLNYGIPVKLVTDNRSVFKYIRKDKQIEYETNFAFACKQLGIELDTTSIPQKKGTVERKFSTLQDRLASELTFYNINNIEKCNEYLQEFIVKHNANLQLNDTINVFDSQINEEQIDKILCIHSTRTISRCCISYKGNRYIPINVNGNDIFIQDKIKVSVIESVNGNIFIEYLDMFYCVRKIENYETYSKLMDLDKKEIEKTIKEKKKYIPPLNHPWRNYNKNKINI
ncbi:hypothetical protein [Oceanivirga salmonicida]|uniref:hypothetical protein n=1 Tax=Oceanivirga salmonicida TaxID=1769291 RepID=UPI0012E18C83|nr:hypothetical protein [Oceanivirga salmonicida]